MEEQEIDLKKILQISYHKKKKIFNYIGFGGLIIALISLISMFYFENWIALGSLAIGICVFICTTLMWKSEVYFHNLNMSIIRLNKGELSMSDFIRMFNLKSFTYYPGDWDK